MASPGLRLFSWTCPSSAYRPVSSPGAFAAPIGWMSVKRIVAGDLSAHFYFGAVVVGLIFPVVVVLYSVHAGIASIPPALLMTAILGGLIGDLTVRYCILKGGLYSPLI